MQGNPDPERRAGFDVLCRPATGASGGFNGFKAASLLESFFAPSFSRDQYSWSDLAQTLAQRFSQGDIVRRDDLFLLVDQFKSPASEFYLQALNLL